LDIAHSEIDESLQRSAMGDFAFPLGTYPVERAAPRAGFAVEFEPADGDEEGGDWEEWPDRYAFDIVISATRLPALCRALFALLPARVHPILDVLGQDAYREVDPYIAYDPVGFDRFMGALRRHAEWFYEDGLVGFGAMSVDPFVYVFVDEHKVVTVRVEMEQRERVERILAAFDLTQTEEPVGVDGALHEHRTVLYAPPDREDLMTGEEVVEELIDQWRLKLNVDRFRNLDEEGVDLGVTPWRCLARLDWAGYGTAGYAEALVTAESLDEAERLTIGATEEQVSKLTLAPPGSIEDAELEFRLVTADRLLEDEFQMMLEEQEGEGEIARFDAPADSNGVHRLRWLIDDGGGEDADDQSRSGRS